MAYLLAAYKANTRGYDRDDDESSEFVWEVFDDNPDILQSPEGRLRERIAGLMVEWGDADRQLIANEYHVYEIAKDSDLGDEFVANAALLVPAIKAEREAAHRADAARRAEAIRAMQEKDERATLARLQAKYPDATK